MTFDRRALISSGMVLAAGAAVAGPRVAEAARRKDAGRSARPGLTPNSGRDATAALQAAIDDSAQLGQVLMLPPGHFLCGPLVLRPGSHIAGHRGQTVVEYVGGGGLFTATAAADVTVEDLILDGAMLALDGTASSALLSLQDCTNMALDRVTVRRSFFNGVSLTRCSGRVSDCSVSEAAQAGLFSLDAAGLAIVHSTIADCGNNGIQVWRSAAGEDGTLVLANRIERIAARAGGSGENGNGINVFRAAGVIVSNNRISDCAYSAIRGNAASNIQMTGNSVTRVGEVALYAEFGFEGALIANNLIDGAASGIAVTNFNEGGRLAVVQGNLVRNLKRREAEPVDKRGDGISIEADASVSGNMIEGAESTGIVVGWGRYLRDVAVTGNVVRQAANGILISADPDGGSCLVSQNLISGAANGAIRAMKEGEPVGPDLAREAPGSGRIVVSGNLAA